MGMIMMIPVDQIPADDGFAGEKYKNCYNRYVTVFENCISKMIYSDEKHYLGEQVRGKVDEFQMPEYSLNCRQKEEVEGCKMRQGRYHGVIGIEFRMKIAFEDWDLNGMVPYTELIALIQKMGYCDERAY